MKDLDDQKKIAVLIDADNASYNKLKKILDEISTHGHIVTKRAYGDWSSGNLKNWKNGLNEYAIQPIQQFAYTTGKNSTDAAMIIDAMDLLYTDKYDAFVLVSSDSDFTKIASRLRESEIFVFGVGESKTPISFRNACDDFILVENLEKDIATAQEPIVEEEATTIAVVSDEHAEVSLTPSMDDVLVLIDNASDKYSDADGWTNVSSAGQYIKRLRPDFDPRTYGYTKLPQLISSFPKIYEIKRYSGKGTVTIIAYKKKAT